MKLKSTNRIYLMNKHELIKAKEICDNATPGPWETNDSRYSVFTPANHEVESVFNHGTKAHTDIVCNAHIQHAESKHNKGNMEFIAASRTLVPSLLDLVEKQRKTIEFLDMIIGLLLKKENCTPKPLTHNDPKFLFGFHADKNKAGNTLNKPEKLTGAHMDKEPPHPTEDGVTSRERPAKD